MACGSVGSGKTHLCTAICGALLDQGKFVRYMLWRDESVKLKAIVNDGEYEAEIKPLKNCQVLYIDDLFKGGATAADIKLAFEILNSRYNRRLTTIISCEKTPEELLAIDEALGSRIYERSKGNCVVIHGSKNWRLRK
jgi:DNA replication protein DnaC